MSLLAGWQRSSHTNGRFTFDTYRRGAGPGVILMHESPGLTPEVITFGHDLTRAGYTVVMPHFFGSAEQAPHRAEAVGVLVQVCIRREFTLLATGRTTPVAGWLRSLAAGLHAELGGVGIGAIGMCFTGGFALAMMLDPSVVAPVVAQPAIPLATDRRPGPGRPGCCAGAGGRRVPGAGGALPRRPRHRYSLRDPDARAGGGLSPRRARRPRPRHPDGRAASGRRGRRARLSARTSDPV